MMIKETLPMKWPIKTLLILLSVFGLMQRANAATQQYEPMSESIRLALRSAVHDELEKESFDIPDESFYERGMWLVKQSDRLKRFIKNEDERLYFLRMLRYEATRAGLSPDLVLAVIHVESGFKNKITSNAGARGLMQIMPFWSKVIGDGDPDKLFHARTNLRYGCTILKHYLDMEKGDITAALARYNGSIGRAVYPRAVFSTFKRWQ
jgi:soluble lytic murein transglycosylase-like protein